MKILPATVSLSDVDFGQLTKEIRKARQLTQEQLARELDVTFGTVNGWENGRHKPIPALGRRIVELATAAGIGTIPRKAARPSVMQPRSQASGARRRSR